MKQTSKVIAGLVVVLLLIVAAGTLYLYTNRNELVARLIEQEGSEATQTDVNVGSVSIDLGEGTAGVSSLTIANPDGFSNNPAISLEGFDIDLDPLAITSDPVVIRDITVDGARLRIEQTGTENNLKTIVSSLQRLSSGQQATEESAGKKLIIDRFELTGASAVLLVPQLDEEREIKLPRIVLTDIGRATNGATATAVATQILEPIIEQALESAAAGRVKDAIKEKLGDSELTDGLLDRLGNQDSGDDADDDNGSNQ